MELEMRQATAKGVSKKRLRLGDEPVSCPHGHPIFLVDGFAIRQKFDSDFSQGGHGWRYRFIPKGEIWVEERLEAQELPFVIGHECDEVELMREGMDYDRAHDVAKRREDAARRRGKL
jgi:hypothetical protein